MHLPSLPPQKAEHSIGGPNVAKARRQAQSASSKGPPRRCASVDGYRCVRSDPSPGQTLASINSTPRTASAIANWRVSHSTPLFDVRHGGEPAARQVEEQHCGCKRNNQWNHCEFTATRPLTRPISSQALAAKTAGRDKLSSRSKHRVQFFLGSAPSMESGDAAVAIGRFTMVRLSFT